MTDIQMESSKKILIIDDDMRLQSAVMDFMLANGYEGRSLSSGKAVFEALEQYTPDIILLDVMMPGEDGFSVLRRIRSVSTVPVIMLTAKGEDTDRIVGLELGADDYLSKPFNPRELLARIKAVLRRSASTEIGLPGPVMAENQDSRLQASSVTSAYASKTLVEGPFVLDTKQQSLSRNGKTIELSTTEFCVLYAFMTHMGVVLSREQLQVLAFGRDDYASPRNIDVYISRLRAILRQLGEESVRIRTVWGTGYCWIKDE